MVRRVYRHVRRLLLSPDTSGEVSRRRARGLQFALRRWRRPQRPRFHGYEPDSPVAGIHGMRGRRAGPQAGSRPGRSRDQSRRGLLGHRAHGGAGIGGAAARPGAFRHRLSRRTQGQRQHGGLLVGCRRADRKQGNEHRGVHRRGRVCRTGRCGADGAICPIWTSIIPGKSTFRRPKGWRCVPRTRPGARTRESAIQRALPSLLAAACAPTPTAMDSAPASRPAAIR